MVLAIILFTFLFVFLVDYLPRVRGGGFKLEAVYIGLSALSLAVLVLYTLDIALPSPSDSIRRVIDGLIMG